MYLKCVVSWNWKEIQYIRKLSKLEMLDIENTLKYHVCKIMLIHILNFWFYHLGLQYKHYIIILNVYQIMSSAHWLFVFSEPCQIKV